MARRYGLLFWLGCAVLVAFAAGALLAPFVAPYDAHLPSGPPLATPAPGHLLGTNGLGQDVLSQLLYGARTSLLVAAAVTALSALLSWLVGLTAGFFRRAEAPLMAVTDLLLALPELPLYLLVLTLIGPSLRGIVLLLALTSWPSFARVVRSVVLRQRAAPYVDAARAIGASAPRLLWRHLLPATLDVLPTKLILTVRYAVFAEATLAFLGLGSGDAVSWGTMLSWAFDDPLLFSRPVWPWLVLPPTLAIMTVLLSTAWVSGALGNRRVAHAGRAGYASKTARRQPGVAERAGAPATGDAGS